MEPADNLREVVYVVRADEFIEEALDSRLSLDETSNLAEPKEALTSHIFYVNNYYDEGSSMYGYPDAS